MQRKSDHINVALKSQVNVDEHDTRFHYEPLLSAHPKNYLPEITFTGKKLKAPLWVSSMTGGTEAAYQINSNLAKACREFGMGMGLGSCRTLLFEDTHLHDFDLRDTIGDDLPFFANLGIVQIEQFLHANKTSVIHKMVKRLRADGLIIHVNPLQEWFQPEGDRLLFPPIETIGDFINEAPYPVIIKEVGQGMGPGSLRELFKIPVAGIEFASFGGTNFARVELLRGTSENHYLYEPYTRVGETGTDMVNYVNDIIARQTVPKNIHIIISGGIRNFLDGYYFINKINTDAIYGQASGFLRHAKENYDNLKKYCEDQINGLKLAFAFLTVK